MVWFLNGQALAIRKRLKSGLIEVQILYGWALAMAIALVPTIRKQDHSKSRHFCPDFKWFLTNWQPFVQIGLLDFRSHSKSRPFATQTIFDHLKSRLGQISDLHCTY